MNVVRPFAATSRERAHGADREPQLRGETLVRICSLEKTYQSKDGSSIHALANINLEIRAAEFVSVVGPSGCGKTTLLKILAGILDRTSGEVEMAGSRLRGPRSFTYCFGRSSPVTLRTKERRRSPSPPASTTAHQCLLRGVKSTGTQQERVNPRFVGNLIQRRETKYPSHEKRANAGFLSNRFESLR